jgi:hypothetical protein
MMMMMMMMGKFKILGWEGCSS